MGSDVAMLYISCKTFGSMAAVYSSMITSQIFQGSDCELRKRRKLQTAGMIDSSHFLCGEDCAHHGVSSTQHEFTDQAAAHSALVVREVVDHEQHLRHSLRLSPRLSHGLALSLYDLSDLGWLEAVVDGVGVLIRILLEGVFSPNFPFFRLASRFAEPNQ